MSKIREKCKDLLKGFDIPERQKEAFYSFLEDAERRALHARWIYPLVYVVLGGVAWLGFGAFASMSWEKWGKFFGAVVGLASALVVLWQPKVTLTQDDCQKYLARKLPGSDLQELNAFLSLPNKKHDNFLKLIGAAGSFLAIYLTLR